MNNYYGILEDLDRCIGCHACRVACEQANDLIEGDSWINVITLGPKSILGKKSAEYIIKIDDNCHMFHEKSPQGLQTPCVKACIPKALMFCNTEGIISLLKGKGRRYQICKVLEDKN